MIQSTRDFGLFVALAAVWGASFPAIKTGLEVLPPVLFAAFRYDIAGAVLLAYVLARRATGTLPRWRPRTRVEYLQVAIGGVLLIGVHFSLLFAGQQYVSSAVGAVVLSLTPVLTPMFALLLLPGTRLQLNQLLGILLGLVGVVVIADPTPMNIERQAIGALILLAAAASFALGSVLSRRVDGTLPAVPMQAWMMVLGAGILHLTSVAFGESMPGLAAWEVETGFALAYLALVCSAGGFLVYFDLLDRVGPVRINLVNYVIPVFAAITGAVFLDEAITLRAVAGFLVVAAGFSLLEWELLLREATRARAWLRERRVPPSAHDAPTRDAPTRDASAHDAPPHDAPATPGEDEPWPADD